MLGQLTQTTTTPPTEIFYFKALRSNKKTFLNWAVQLVWTDKAAADAGTWPENTTKALFIFCSWVSGPIV